MGYDTFKGTFDIKMCFVEYHALINLIPKSYKIILSGKINKGIERRNNTTRLCDTGNHEKIL